MAFFRRMGGIVLQYHQVVKGRFLRRPNRFIAHVETEDGLQICHVKNTGRCRELLVPGAAVYLHFLFPNRDNPDKLLVDY